MSVLARHEICEVLRECYKRGWISTRDGNASILDDNRLYITPSGVRKKELHIDQIVEMPVINGEPRNPTLSKPSGEFEMHWLLQQHGAQSVLHVHPTHVIAAMLSGIDLQKLEKEFPELSRYTAVGKVVPILPPISVKLAKATHKALCYQEVGYKYDIVGQKNHGVAAIGTSMWEAFEHVERLDHICQIALLEWR